MSLYVDIEKNFGDFKLKANFETDGGTLGLLGASGCGKSMTLKCIAGFVRPDRGRIVLDGNVLFDSEKRIDLSPQKRKVGYLFQNYALFPNMTARQNIECGVRYLKDRTERGRRVREIMEMFGISDLAGHRPAQMSGGQQQRVALARILVNRPQLLMLDEPFSALDSHLRMRLQIELKELLEHYGRDTLMVTHSRDEAYHMCGRIAVMDEGRILAIKETKQLFADPGTVRAAQLTGCKNISVARKTGDHEVEVKDWGIRLKTAQPVRDDVCAVAIRAHYYHPNAAQNRFPVELVLDLEEPFEWIIHFRYKDQDPGSECIWWRLPKDKRPQQFPETLGVAPVNVLPLYPEEKG